jgi:hypothetical protein
MSSSSDSRIVPAFDKTLPDSLEALLQSSIEQQQIKGVAVSTRYKAFSGAAVV